MNTFLKMLGVKKKSDKVSQNTIKRAYLKDRCWQCPTGTEVRFPNRCVCCNEPFPDSGLFAYHSYSYGGVRHTTVESGFNVPYCKFCKSHDYAPHLFGWWFFIALFGSFFVYVDYIDKYNTLKPLVQLELITGIIVFILIGIYLVIKILRRKANCSSKISFFNLEGEGAVTFNGGSFYFRNQKFAEEFALLNGSLISEVN